MIITGRNIDDLAELLERAEGLVNNDLPSLEDRAIYLLANRVTMLPCEIGDEAWAIRNYSGHKKAIKGKVSEMYFIERMTLTIVVKGVARGQWGKDVFATREECERAINGGDRYFTPDDVRNMSHAEVRENYTAIRRSMKTW